jgi:hypothetical protein
MVIDWVVERVLSPLDADNSQAPQPLIDCERTEIQAVYC